MAIGLGKIFGFDFVENFNYPYSAISVTDFWKRWHISLTTWFRDYLYIPLGGNRCSKIKWLRNFLLIWLFTGLWHGASWNFVLWGLFYAAVLLIEKQFLKSFIQKIPRFITWFVTFFIVNFGWLLFRVNSLKDFSYIINSFFHPTGDFTSFISNNYSITSYFIFMLLGFVFMFPLWPKFQSFMSKRIFRQAIFDLIVVTLFMIAICSLISNSYNPFIYFRF